MELDQKQQKFLSVNEAIAYIEELGYGPITGQTIREWCNNRGIGLKFGGRWKVNKKKLDKLMKGEW